MRRTGVRGEPVESEEPQQEIKQEKPEKNRVTVPDGPYDKKPFIRDQYAERPDTVRYSRIQAATFRSDDASGMEDYNDLLNRSQYRSNAPGILITDMQREFFDGVFHIFVLYSELEYRQNVKAN